jgi:hypothetical protein
VALVVGIKPIGTVQISLDGKIYQLENVATVSEVRERLQEISGMTNETLEECRILWQGKLLKSTDILRRVGVKEGTQLVAVLPTTTTTATTPSEDEPKDSQKSKKKKAKESSSSGSSSRSFMFGGKTLSEHFQAFQEEWKNQHHHNFNNNEQQQQQQQSRRPSQPPQNLFEWMNDSNMDYTDLLESLRSIHRDDVARRVRESMSVGYHRVREFWNTPAFRAGIRDAGHIETARQSILANTEAKRAIEQVPGGKELLQNRQAWQEYFQTFSDVTLTAGDAILDGLLDVLMDILKSSSSGGGSGSPWNSNARGGIGSDSSSSSSSVFPVSDTIDPSVASDVLFELSESEEEEY